MIGRFSGRQWGGFLGASCVSLAALAIALPPAPVGADSTDPTTLLGEGGSFLTPVTDVLLKADTGLAPLNPEYTDANLDSAIADFAGNGPNSFDTDFVVSERPLTSAEAATAKANGRTFAYVPFAATPVAIATLAVCNPVALTGNSTSALCPDVPLTVPLVAQLFTFNLTSPSVSPNQGLPTSLTGWSDPRLTQANGQPMPNGGIYQASTLEPSAENTALMSLLDSNPTAKELFDNALNNPAASATTNSDTPSEIWPFHGVHAFVGGDAGLVGKELNIDAETNSPSAANSWNLGDVFPLASVWAGAPQGTPWNIPTAAIQNAAGKFVAPSEAAAAASESDATMNPSTNLVTFAANPSNAAAYNNYLMVESYLVVPTSGLTAVKAQKLAQLIRFIVGPVAESDEETVGSAPPTPAMAAADLKVATQLDDEAAPSTAALSTSTSPSGSSGSPTTTATSTTSTTVAAVSAGATSASASTGGTGNTGSGAGLATTGATDVVPALAVGAALVVLGATGRRRTRRLRRREVRS
jgi:ABC-type phosphate transport system substrate-binding protein